MTNLINTDNAGNGFYNYITPTQNGEVLNHGNIDFAALCDTTWGSGKYIRATGFGLPSHFFRPPAPGLETKTGTVSTNVETHRFFTAATYNNAYVASGGAGTTTYAYQQLGGYFSRGAGNVTFAVINDYSVVLAHFTDETLSTLIRFVYLGWLRENVYNSPVGAVAISYTQYGYFAHRPSFINSTTPKALSTAADSITSPPIVCTAGTDPGNGSETATDIVIRDALAPHNPVGKLWNCIDLPATCNVGGLYKNIGNYDADGSISNKDVYLCVMPWGTRKLGMRVWTENV